MNCGEFLDDLFKIRGGFLVVVIFLFFYGLIYVLNVYMGKLIFGFGIWGVVLRNFFFFVYLGGCGYICVDYR